jgi:hypothetical protein
VHFHQRPAAVLQSQPTAAADPASTPPRGPMERPPRHAQWMPGDASRVELRHFKRGQIRFPAVQWFSSRSFVRLNVTLPSAGSDWLRDCTLTQSGISACQGERAHFPAVAGSNQRINHTLSRFVCLINPVTTSDLRIPAPNRARHALQAPRKRGRSERTHGDARVSVRRPHPSSAARVRCVVCVVATASRSDDARWLAAIGEGAECAVE